MGNTLAKVLKDHKDSIRVGSAHVKHHKFTTGLLGLNAAVGVDGYIPGGSIIQLIGEPKHGKSTLATDIVAQAQQSGIKEVEIPDGKATRSINALWLDFEHSFDPEYAAILGVDLEKLLILEPRYGEEGFDIVEAFLSEGLQLVVVDSVPMFEPKSEQDKTFADDPEKMSSNANPLTRILRRMLHLVSAADALMILINQYRANISQMSRKEKKPYGARAIQYVARVTIELVRVKNEDTRAHVIATVEKTKLGPEGKQVPFQLEFGKGINYTQHIFELATTAGIIEKGGAWYYYKDMQAHGEAKAMEIFPIDEIKTMLETGEIVRPTINKTAKS
jgi:recombination protein RecA